MDSVTTEVRSRMMARIKDRNTGPEMALRKALWAVGLRYRLHPRLPGKPDLAFMHAKVAVLVDGCFWHSCPLHGSAPKSNVDYWQPKLARTHVRDQAANSALAVAGWLPLRLWEHEIVENIGACVERVAEAVKLRS